MSINKYISPLPANQPWPRDYLVTILQTAMSVQEFRFTRQTALHWLVSYPGDLPIDLIHGQALLGEGHIQQAQKIAKKICGRDPEYLEAQELLNHTHIKTGSKGDPVNQGNIQALGGLLSDPKNHAKGIPKMPKWTSHLQKARKALNEKDLLHADAQVQHALAFEADTPLVALTHLRILAEQPETPSPALQNLASHFHQRWPECVQFMLLLSDALMDGGDSGQGVALLHQATAFDVTGQVARRLWGENHPYRDLWPSRLTAIINIPIPARVAATLGWNLLDIPHPPEKSADHCDKAEQVSENGINPNFVSIPEIPADRESTDLNLSSKSSDPLAHEQNLDIDPPETLRSVQAELENMGERLQKPNLARSDGRFPTYVILSTRKGLREKYGRAGMAMLEAAMKELAAAVRRQPDWGSIVFFVDDPACTSEFNIKPTPADDPWAIKLALTDLDAALGKKGMMIGATLIVGGPQIVPFHTLPNPTDDTDIEVPSDNPYATRDENYFIPEWPVGRLPFETGNNPALLLSALQDIAVEHTTRITQDDSWWQRIWGWLLGILYATRKIDAESFGFSAEVWRKASVAVYQQIGKPGDLVTSPPIDIESQETAPLNGQLGYYNLHGLADTDEWYGQRDTSNGSSGPDYPVALRVKDVRNGGSAPEIIFSEACYGAHIIGKSAKDSLALKFLASGSQVLVGSTVMSYGSISTPLNAADLLGVAFWKFLKDGNSAGEALLRAKVYLAREMHKRQGYLDGEDQKTLISFVLFGDPLARPTDLKRTRHKRSKAAIRSINPPAQVKTVCDRNQTPGKSEPIPEEVMAHVKQVVAHYLPGMQGAQVMLSHEHADCNCEGHYCPTAQLGQKARPVVTPERRVVTLSKSIPLEKHSHPTYARLTLDKQGKVVKLAVSR